MNGWYSAQSASDAVRPSLDEPADVVVRRETQNVFRRALLHEFAIAENRDLTMPKTRPMV